MKAVQIKKIKSIFKAFSDIKLVYFFGSKAVGKNGPLSDYDFAVYLDENDINKLFKIKFILTDQISRLLKTDKVDVVVLNLVESPELKFNIIKEGKLIFEKEPFKIVIEPKILHEYFDFHDLLLRYNLTKA